MDRSDGSGDDGGERNLAGPPLPPPAVLTWLFERPWPAATLFQPPGAESLDAGNHAAAGTLRIEILRARAAREMPAPLGMLYLGEPALVDFLGVIGISKLSALGSAWAFLRIPADIYAADVRRLYVFHTPIFGINFVLSAIKNGACTPLYAQLCRLYSPTLPFWP